MSTIGDSPPPPPPPSDAHPKNKIACINTYDHDSPQSEWYVFDVSDHNQPPPPPPYPNFIHYLTPFHHEDYHTEPRDHMIKPIATAETNLIYRWDIMPGPTLPLYHIPDDFNFIEVDRVELGGAPTAKWSHVRRLPRYASLHHAVALGGKLYCTGEEERSKQLPGPWAMVYDPAQNEWEALPDPPQRPRHFYDTFSAAVQVPKPCVVVGSDRDNLLQVYKSMTSQKIES